MMMGADGTMRQNNPTLMGGGLYSAPLIPAGIQRNPVE